MPFPGSGCNHSKPIKVKVNLGSTNALVTHPVKIAPTDSKKHNRPKKILKTISALLSICLNKYLFNVVLG